MADHSDSSPLVPPLPLADPSEIDLEAGPSEQIQCRICLETDVAIGTVIVPRVGYCSYEGFAFAHCTTCKAPYHLRVHVAADRKWRTLKFRFFVTRDILFIFLSVQLVIASLAYLVYLIDGYQQYWLRLLWGFDSEMSFYYICGALLFFALLGLSGCFITCYDRRVRNDLAQPCRELCLCCCQPGMPETMLGVVCADCHLPGTLCMWTDCTTCFESCGTMATECGGCLGGAGEAGLPLLFIMALIVLGLFTVIGIFYSVLVATMVVHACLTSSSLPLPLILFSKQNSFVPPAACAAVLQINSSSLSSLTHPSQKGCHTVVRYVTVDQDPLLPLQQDVLQDWLERM
ncbi:hypothetical protein glysoja_022991 [Glycine soja]|nr:hypothetical protein glysoja_022991 [Glycine soja]